MTRNLTRYSAIAGVALVSLAAQPAVAQSYLSCMNQIDARATLADNPEFGVIQTFEPNLHDYNSTVIEDTACGPIVNGMSVGFIRSVPFSLTTIKGWRVSFWSNPTDASNSGPNLTGNAIDTGYFTNVTYGQLGAAGAHEGGWYVDIHSMNLNVGSGIKWFGAAADLDFQGANQVFILANPGGVNMGGGAPGNSIGINPINGFGLGSVIQTQQNAAYGLQSVPEPGTLLALGAGLAALAARRRRKEAKA